MRAAPSIAAVLIALCAVGTFFFIRSHSPSFQTAADWYGPSAPLLAIGDSTLSGSVQIRPSGSGDYVIESVARDANNQQVRTLSMTLVHGRCSEFTASPARLITARDPLMPWIQSSGGSIWFWPVTRVRASEVSGPLVVLVSEGTGSTKPVACADVPVTADTSFSP